MTDEGSRSPVDVSDPPGHGRLRRVDAGLDGILVVDKPVGPTSHDIVALVRRLAGTKRIGHGGSFRRRAGHTYSFLRRRWTCWQADRVTRRRDPEAVYPAAFL